MWAAGCEVLFPFLQTLTFLHPPTPGIHIKPPYTQSSPPPTPAQPAFSKNWYPEAPFPHQPQLKRVWGKCGLDSGTKGSALSFPYFSRPHVPAPGLIFYLTLLLQETALGSCRSAHSPSPAKSILYFLFHPRQVSAEAVVLSSSETGSNRPELDLVAVETQFLPLC